MLDQFDANFRSDENGQIYYWPRRKKVGLPISGDEYDAVTAAFERRHVIGMAFMWLAMFGALGSALYQLAVRDSLTGAFLSILAGPFIAMLFMVRDQLGIMASLNQRYREMVKAMKADG